MSTSPISELTNLQFLMLNCIPNSMDVRAQDLKDLNKLEFITANFCDIKEFNTYVKRLVYIDCVLTNYHLVSYALPLVESYDDADEDYSQNIVTLAGIDMGNITVLPGDIECLIIRKCDRWAWSRCLCCVFTFGNKYDSQQIQLKIERCVEVEYLCCFCPSCRFCSHVQLVNELMVIGLDDLKNLASPIAPSLHKSGTVFSHLKHFYISECHSMKTLLMPRLSTQFQNLESIYVEDCESMEEIVGEEDFVEMILAGSGNLSHQTITLPKLKSVELQTVPELNFVYRGIMLCPSLRAFYANYCMELNRPQVEISNRCALQLEETSNGYSYRKN